MGAGGLQDRYTARPQGEQGTPSTHPILGDELRALRRLKRQQEPKSPFVFTSERGAPAYLGHRNIQHREVYRVVADAVQGFLAELTVATGALRFGWNVTIGT
jgi:hypothetical protein